MKLAITLLSVFCSFISFGQISYLNLNGLTNASPLVGVPIGATGHTFDAFITNNCSNPNPQVDNNGNFSFRHSTSSMTCEQCLTIIVSTSAEFHITDNTLTGHGILEFADSLIFNNNYVLTDPLSLINYAPAGPPGLWGFTTPVNISAYNTWNLTTIATTIRICGTRRASASFGNLKTPIRIGVVTGTLPIELLDFTAKISNNNTTQLDWSTASERDNDFFTIERSSDNFDWEEMTTVKGAGNSTELLEYQTTVPSEESGIYYFRLKQTDFNGEFSYSDVISLNYGTDLMMYPNPALNEIYISGDDLDPAEIRVSDINGKDMTSAIDIQNHANDEVRLNLFELKSGIYIVTVGEKRMRFMKVSE